MNFYKFLDDAKDGRFHKNGEVMYFTPEVRENFLKTVPFVFLPNDGTAIVSHIDTNHPLDLPFKTCFFEMLERAITVVEEGDHTIKVIGLWINELKPMHYEILALLEAEGHTSIVFTGDDKLNEHFLKIIKTLLDRLSKDEVGYNNPRKSIKMKINGEKIHHRVDKVVYVSPKRNISAIQGFATKLIDWSHQWSVRGHWREIPGRIGRDREGNPISGNTWVKDHTKGPEDAPLINKTRLVKE